MKKRVDFPLILVGDFETTVYEEQEQTEVWASALVVLHSEDVIIHHSIAETFDYLTSLKRNICVYYHNLKFDGAFWLSFLLKDLQLEQAYFLNGETKDSISFYHSQDMPNNTFKYSINSMGQWYKITIKYHNHYIEFRDSLKLLPFTVKAIGKAFKTKHQKLTMEYEGVRFAGCEITDEEKEYIANDVLVVKEALEIMFSEGHKKLTIGACCQEEFKNEYRYFKNVYEGKFPDLTKITLDKEKYGSKTVDEYVRKSYKGGWCYLVKGKEEQLFHNGTTADVNSLYPSVMHSESGNKYPIGKPKFWKGNYIPLEATEPSQFGEPKFYFVRIRTEFKIKPNMLPCIQIKHTQYYCGREWLETSDVTVPECTVKGVHYTEKVFRNQVEMTLTEMDFKLIQEHYDLYNFEILDGCFFTAEIGLFDNYINKYKKIKTESTGAKRTLAKLFLNNLYGKFATNSISDFKIAYLENNVVKFHTQTENNKEVFYIPIGTAVTSYARNFTIKAAQANYYGKDKDGFIYADTDSIHCNLPPEKIKGIEVHETDFLKWKLEACWDCGWFVRQKTYIEHVTKEDLKEIENPYYNIKCAGMSEKSKQFYQISMLDNVDEWIEDHKEEYEALHETEKEYIKQHRTIEDFKRGFYSVGKLIPRTIKGGVVLWSTTFELR